LASILLNIKIRNKRMITGRTALFCWITARKGDEMHKDGEELPSGF
jgi:hypothetical protein